MESKTEEKLTPGEVDALDQRYQLKATASIFVVSISLIVMDCFSKSPGIAKWADITMMLVGLIMLIQGFVHFIMDEDINDGGWAIDKFKVARVFVIIQLIENVVIIACLAIDLATIEQYMVWKAWSVDLCWLLFLWEAAEFIKSLKDLHMESKIDKDIKRTALTNKE